MSTAGRCIARSTSSGTVVGPGIARNSRPARTLMSCSSFHETAHTSSWIASATGDNSDHDHPTFSHGRHQRACRARHRPRRQLPQRADPHPRAVRPGLGDRPVGARRRRRAEPHLRRAGRGREQAGRQRRDRRRPRRQEQARRPDDLRLLQHRRRLQRRADEVAALRPAERLRLRSPSSARRRSS